MGEEPLCQKFVAKISKEPVQSKLSLALTSVPYDSDIITHWKLSRQGHKYPVSPFLLFTVQTFFIVEE